MTLTCLMSKPNLTNLLLKIQHFTIKEKDSFHDSIIQAPIFTYTIKDKKGVRT